MSKRAEAAIADLKACKPGRPNWRWLGARGLASLPANAVVDRKLVARVMKLVFPHDVEMCRTLAAPYAAMALAELANVTDVNVDAMFLVHYAGGDPTRLNAAGTWLNKAAMMDETPTPRTRARLAELPRDAAGMAAACATVARHGVAAPHLLAILAHAGGDAAVDAVVEAFDAAVAKRDETLDVFAAWFAPFVRGTRMKRLAAEVGEAIAARGGESPILALAARAWGARDATKVKLDVSIDSVQVYKGFTRKMGAWIVLDSHALPNAKAFVTWSKLNFDATRWEDGRLDGDELGIGAPTGIDDLPRWLATAAKLKKVAWDRATLRVTGTLRGKARAAAVAWLYPDV